MSKVYCVECNLVFSEQDVDRLHKESNVKGHKYIKENNCMEAIDLLSKKVRVLEGILNKQYEEGAKVEEVLVSKIQENRIAMNMFRSENKISRIKTKFDLLNCKYSINNDSTCEMFRIKNIVYMKIEFHGKIEEASGKAQIEIKMPMWIIYSGSFNIEVLNNCLKNEEGTESKFSKTKDKDRTLKHLCARYEQVGNKIIIHINQSELDVQTYWAQNNKSKESTFIINGNFLIEPPSLLRNRKYYIYSPLEDKVLCEKNNSLSLTDKWESGSLLELCVDNNKEVVKINGKYLNNDNGRLKLEQKDVSGFNVYAIPGYADITLLYLLNKVKEQDKEVVKTNYLEAKGDDIILGNEINDKCQFFLIPELKKGEKKQ